MHRLTTTAVALTVLLAGILMAAEVHEAATAGDVAALQTLIENNPDLLTTPDSTGSLPLHLAALRGQLEAVELLVDAGAEVSVGDGDNTTPLVCATIGGHLEVVKYLVSQGASLTETDNYGQTALTTAGSVELVDYLLDNGADIHRRDLQGRTILHTAAFRGNGDMIRHLVSKGADLHARDNDSMSVLCGAAYSGRVEAIETLIELGCDINEAPTIHDHTPMVAAVWNGHAEALALLAAHGGDLMWRNAEGSTLLHTAAQRGSSEIAQVLIDHGLDINVTDNHDVAPIFEAAWEQTEMLQWLIDHGASANAANDSAPAPLGPTVFGNNAEGARILLAAGANPNRSPQGDAIPLRNAVVRGYAEVAAALLDAGADVDIREPRTDRTPLHFATIGGKADMAELLITRGAEIDSRDKDNQTPLAYAAKYAHRDVADLLKEKGASAEGIVESYGPPALLSEVPALGEAAIWYLGHSGWGIRTANHFLIFDYFEEPPRPAHPCLANGNVDAEELATVLGDTKVFVFSTHEHGDHYDTVIFDWRDALPNATYVLGHEPPDQTGYKYIPERTDRQLGDIHVWTIHSTDAGVGYLIEVDGLTIFHAGDHANGEVGLHAEYTDEIDYLAGLDKPMDVAFLPITGCSLGTPESVREGVYYALEKLSINLYFPQHGGSATYRYREFVDAAREAGFNVAAACAENGGDSFIYEAGDAL